MFGSFLYFYAYRMVFAFLFIFIVSLLCVYGWWMCGLACVCVCMVGGWLTLRTKCDWLTEWQVHGWCFVGFLLFFCGFVFCLYIYIFIWLGPEDQSRLFALIIIIVIGVILFALFRWFFRRFRTLFGTAIGSTAAAVGLEIFDGTIVIVLGLGCLSLPLLNRDRNGLKNY